MRQNRSIRINNFFFFYGIYTHEFDQSSLNWRVSLRIYMAKFCALGWAQKLLFYEYYSILFWLYIVFQVIMYIFSLSLLILTFYILSLPKIGFRVVMEIVFNLNIYFLLMIYFQSQGSAFIVSTKGADLILMLILKWYGLFRLGTNTPLSMVIIACIILRQRFFHMK